MYAATTPVKLWAGSVRFWCQVFETQLGVAKALTAFTPFGSVLPSVPVAPVAKPAARHAPPKPRVAPKPVAKKVAAPASAADPAPVAPPAAPMVESAPPEVESTITPAAETPASARPAAPPADKKPAAPRAAAKSEPATKVTAPAKAPAKPRRRTPRKKVVSLAPEPTSARSGDDKG